MPETNESSQMAHQIFKISPQIKHLVLINDEGRVLLDQASSEAKPLQPDLERIYYYYQMEIRRKQREFFNEYYGKTEYIHIPRKKIQQIIVYRSSISIYLTLEKSASLNDISQIVKEIKNIDEKIINQAISSPYFRMAK